MTNSSRGLHFAPLRRPKASLRNELSFLSFSILSSGPLFPVLLGGGDDDDNNNNKIKIKKVSFVHVSYIIKMLYKNGKIQYKFVLRGTRSWILEWKTCEC